MKTVWKLFKRIVKAYCRAAEASGWYSWNLYGRNFSTDVK